MDEVGTLSRGVVVELSQQVAIEAARLSVQYKLAMAGCLILATARAYPARLWTQDAHFKEIEGVRYIEKKALSAHADRPQAQIAGQRWVG